MNLAASTPVRLWARWRVRPDAGGRRVAVAQGRTRPPGCRRDRARRVRLAPGGYADEAPRYVGASRRPGGRTAGGTRSGDALACEGGRRRRHARRSSRPRVELGSRGSPRRSARASTTGSQSPGSIAPRAWPCTSMLRWARRCSPTACVRPAHRGRVRVHRRGGTRRIAHRRSAVAPRQDQADRRQPGRDRLVQTPDAVEGRERLRRLSRWSAHWPSWRGTPARPPS